MKKLLGFSKDKSGATAVEFALIFPLFCGMLLGTFELGMAMYERAQVSAAIAEGARAVAIYGDDEAKIKDAVKGVVSKHMKDDLKFAFTTETYDSQQFKKIEITYKHDLLIGLGKYMSDINIKATRYTPVIKVASTETSTTDGTN